jgi:hypothetical protein
MKVEARRDMVTSANHPQRKVVLGEKVHNARPFTKVVHNTPIGTGCPHHAKIK